MPSGALPASLVPHRRFLGRLERFFGLSGVVYREDAATPDIAALPAQNAILIGRRWRRAERPEQQKRLLHEAAHLWGMQHDTAARTEGYFSNPQRDAWSRRVYADLQSGTPTFDPAKFGVGADLGVRPVPVANPTTPRGQAREHAMPKKNPLPAGLLGNVAANILGNAAYDVLKGKPAKEEAPVTTQNPAAKAKYDVGEAVTFSRIKPRFTVSKVTKKKGGFFGGGGYSYQLYPDFPSNIVASEGEIKRLNPRRGRNPIAEGELVRVPALDTTGIVKERIEEGGLLGSSTKFRVEVQTQGGVKSVIIPSRGVRRLNPSRERQSAPCPACRHQIRVPKNATEIICPHCDGLLRVERHEPQRGTE